MKYASVIAVFFLLLVGTKTTAQVVIDGKRKKDIPFFLEYNQLERGFLSVEADCRFRYGEVFPSFRNFGFAAGYNPWQNALLLEQKSYFNFVFFSVGMSLSYIDPLGTGAPSSAGIKPQIGLDFYALRFYYGYYFTVMNRPSYLNYHNITLSVFLFGKDEFYTWREKGKWYSWPSVFRDDL